MTDRFDHVPPDPVELEARRIAYAVARVADHAEHELVLLERAAHAPDDDVARALEYAAGTAHRDCIALTEEHDLDR